MLVCPADFKSVWRVLILSAVSSILTRSRKQRRRVSRTPGVFSLSTIMVEMRPTPSLSIFLALLLACNSSAVGQPEAPFTVDENTLALWHMDQSEPDSLWSVMYGGADVDVCMNAVRTSDGNYIAVGYTDSFGAGERDIWVIKLNDDGDSLWSRTYGSPYYDYCHNIIDIGDGHFLLACSSGQRSREDFLLLEINADGDSLWSRTYGGDAGEICNRITLDDDRGLIMAGSTRSYGSGLTDMWILKLDADREPVWDVPLGGDRTESCLTVVKTSDSGYLAGGYSTSDRISSDGWLVKLNQHGEIEWNRFYGGNNSDRIKEIIPTEHGYLCFGYNAANFWLFEVNSDGAVIWEEIYGGIIYSYANDIIQTADHGWLLTGAYHMDDGQYNLGMMKADNQGRRAWMRNFGGLTDEKINCVIQTDDYGYMLFGTADSIGAGEEDWLIMRTAADLIMTADVSCHDNHCSVAGEVDTAAGRWNEGLKLTPQRFGALTVEDDSSLHPQEFTVECWFRMSDSVRFTGALVVKMLDIEYASYMLYASSETDVAGFIINTENGEFVLECDVAPDTTWHYLAGTYDGARMRLFFDGEFTCQRYAGGEVLYDDGQLIIGSDDDLRLGDFQFFGVIDEVRLSSVVRDYLDVSRDGWRGSAPGTFRLWEAYPNPFNSTITITYTLPSLEPVSIKILDVAGREVTTLVGGLSAPGRHRVVWDAAGVVSGIYFCRMEAADNSRSIKLILTR